MFHVLSSGNVWNECGVMVKVLNSVIVDDGSWVIDLI